MRIAPAENHSNVGSGDVYGVGGWDLSLLRQATPDEKRRIVGGSVLALIGLVILVVLVSVGSTGLIVAGVLVGVILLATGVFLAYQALRDSAREWSDLHGQGKSWVCRRCHTAFS